MNKTQFRVFFPDTYPSVNSGCNRFPTLRVSQRCSYPGLFVEIILLIVKELNVELVTVTDNNLVNYDSKYSNQTIGNNNTAILELVQQNIVDTVATSFVNLPFRTTLNFTDTLFYVYDFRIWSSIIAVIFCQALFQLFQRKLQRIELDGYKRSTAKLSIWDHFNEFLESIWLALRLFFFRIGYEQSDRRAAQLNTFLFSFLQAVVVLGVYSSAILSENLKPSPINGMRTFSDLIHSLQRREYYFVTSGDMGWFYVLINSSDSSPYAQIRATFAKNRIRFVDSQEQAIGLALNGEAIVVINDRQPLQPKEACVLVTLASEQLMKKVSLIVGHNSKWLAPINRIINENLVYITKIHRKYLNDTYEVVRNDCTASKPLIGLCIVFFSFCIAAIGVFIFEISMNK